MEITSRSDLRCALLAGASISRAAADRRSLPLPRRRRLSAAASTASFRVRAHSVAAVEPPEKPSACTADELHYVSVSDSNWRVALWRYRASRQAPPRNHPLLLLSGVGTNAIGYDLSPESSFARYMSSQGFDTWILEVRGAGLSVDGVNAEAIKKSSNAVSKIEGAVESDQVSSAEKQTSRTPKALSQADVSEKLTETFMLLSERSSNFPIENQSKDIATNLFDQISKLLEGSSLSERFNEIRAALLSLFESGQKLGIGQIRHHSQRLVNMVYEAQRSGPFTAIIENIQKQMDLFVKFDWDFDHYLEEDVPAAMEYIRGQCNPKDGKLMAIGHSMGGILLYSMLSRYCHEGKDPKLAAITTLAASLDYTSSKSSLKLFLPLANPAQVLNVPVPLGTLLSVAYPLSWPWLISQISAEDMMHPELLEKLMLNNFCTVPSKLLLQLSTAFQEGGLRDRKGTFFYKNHLHKSSVPILAMSGDQDLICPPEAVEGTVKLIPKHLATYEVMGEPGGAHFAHYDLVGGRLAVEKVYPRIIQFFSQYD